MGNKFEGVAVSHTQMTFIVETINAPTAGVLRTAQTAPDCPPFVLVTDRAAPSPRSKDGVEFPSTSDEKELRFLISRAIPETSNSRTVKSNLHAAQSACARIRETNDDNAPDDSFFEMPLEATAVRIPHPPNHSVNVYGHFSERFVRRRGA